MLPLEYLPFFFSITLVTSFEYKYYKIIRKRRKEKKILTINIIQWNDTVIFILSFIHHSRRFLIHRSYLIVLCQFSLYLLYIFTREKLILRDAYARAQKRLQIRKRKIDRETLTIFRDGHFERPINIHEVPPTAARVPRTTFDILVVKLERNQSKKFLWCRASPTNKKRTSSGSHGVIFQRSRQREIRHWGSSYRVYYFSFFFFCHFLEQRASHCPSNLESKSLNDL